MPKTVSNDALPCSSSRARAAASRSHRSQSRYQKVDGAWSFNQSHSSYSSRELLAASYVGWKHAARSGDFTSASQNASVKPKAATRGPTAPELAAQLFQTVASRNWVAFGLRKWLPISRSRGDGDERLSSHSSTVFGCVDSAALHCHESRRWPEARADRARTIATLPPKRTTASTETSCPELKIASMIEPRAPSSSAVPSSWDSMSSARPPARCQRIGDWARVGFAPTIVGRKVACASPKVSTSFGTRSRTDARSARSPTSVSSLPSSDRTSATPSGRDSSKSRLV
jgi:hypothetical protein